MLRSPTLLLPFPFLLFVAFALGCGAKTTLDVPPPTGDAGQQLDAGTDAMPDPGGLAVDCGRSLQPTTPRRPVTLEANATGPAPIVEQGWELVSSPPASMPTVISSSDPRLVTVTPDVVGSFLMRFTAIDTTGAQASCEVEVQSVVGPPVALCPEEQLFTPVGVSLRIEGDGFDDEGVVAYLWEVVSAPAGAHVELMDAELPVATLRSDTRGPHVLRLTVFDADLAYDSCDVTVLVSGPPEVSCDSASVETPNGTPVTLRARATDDVGIASRRWELLERPSGSNASPSPANAETTTLTPDRVGLYRLRFTATDVEGMSASCETTVRATPTAPVVSCPPTIETRPLSPVSITASATDDGTIVLWRWEIESRPTGSGASPPSPANAPSTSFVPDIAGVYVLRVSATDDDGLTDTCTLRVDARNVDGLRVEMFWDTSLSDMDLHLMNPTGTRWATDDVCYYANCNVSVGRHLEWGAPGRDDNPRLDIDNTNGRGPENINIARPVPGTYRVAVHAYATRSRNTTHRVTVRIYCGGSTTEPVRTFGPVPLRTPSYAAENDFWRVADVTVTPTDCTIIDLSRPSGPWIEPFSIARTRR